MLTKDLLRLNLKKNDVRPKFIDSEDVEAKHLASSMLDLIKSSMGKTQSQLEEDLSELCSNSSLDYAKGFEKILLDHIEFSEPEGNFEETRWDLIKQAQNLRTEQFFHSVEEFQETLTPTFQDIYTDLPELRKVTKIVEWSERDFINRYNCALVQSLLLLAPKMQIRLISASTLEKRNLFRSLKFHRLIVGEITCDEDSLAFELDGPLSILMNTQAYGMRLANFFPHLLMLKKWEMKALIKYKKRDYQLFLNNKDGLVSHYKEWGQYRPEEFENFFKAYQETPSDWILEWCDDLLLLAPKAYCFPDMVFTHREKGQKVHLEFFHRWHRGELEKRMELLKKIDKCQMIIGVCNSLIKHDSMGTSPFQEQDLDHFGFIFRVVPTPRAVNTLLNRLYNA